jgi:DNA-binding transcriptional regulator YiaG
MTHDVKTMWTNDRIKALRAATGETAEVFGARFGRSGRTVEDWEQGRRRPDVMVLLAMQRLAPRWGLK